MRDLDTPVRQGRATVAILLCNVVAALVIETGVVLALARVSMRVIGILTGASLRSSPWPPGDFGAALLALPALMCVQCIAVAAALLVVTPERSRGDVLGLRTWLRVLKYGVPNLLAAFLFNCLAGLGDADAALVITAAVYATYWLLASMLIARDESRHIEQHCLNCRHDLTGNVTGTCPECGTSTVLSREKSACTGTREFGP